MEKRRRGKIVGKWEQERVNFMRESGIGVGEEEQVDYKEIERRDSEKQREER